MSTIQPPTVIDLRANNIPLARTTSEPLLNACGMKVIRMEVPLGGEIPRHSTPDQATLQCLSGSIVLHLDEDELRLFAGQLVFLDAHQPHTVRANADSVLLITLRVAEAAKAPTGEEESCAGLDAMDQTAKESFPASDPPAWTPVTGP